MSTKLDWSRWPNFSEDEFRCRGHAKGLCSCGGTAAMDPGFMDRLQAMRSKTLEPFIVTSGYRCPDYNAAIAKTGRNGPHTTGRAVDLLCNGPRAHDILQLAALEGMTGIGVAQRGDHGSRFLHLDDLPAGNYPRPGLWSY